MAYEKCELLDRLRELADELGETPTRRQCTDAEATPSAQTYQKRFGDWNTALQAAGLDVNQNKLVTEDELTSQLVAFADALGETPTTRQLNQDSETPSVTVYQDRFGSWNTALEKAGLDVSVERFTDEKLLRILQELAAELGQTPTKTELRTREQLPSPTTYVARFDSWNDALREAGLSVNQEQEQCNGTDEELLDMLRELAAELNKSPSMADVEFAPGVPNAGVFAHRFGGWNEAKQQADLTTTERPNQYTDAELLGELRCVAQELDRAPTAADMNNADAPSLSTYARRFDSWTAAKEEAGLTVTQETPTQ